MTLEVGFGSGVITPDLPVVLAGFGARKGPATGIHDDLTAQAVVVRQDGQAVGRFEGGAYILPGARKRLPIEAAKLIPVGALQLVVTFDDGSTQSFDVPPI